MCKKTKGNYRVTKDDFVYRVHVNDFNDTDVLDGQPRCLLYHLFDFINH